VRRNCKSCFPFLSFYLYHPPLIPLKLLVIPYVAVTRWTRLPLRPGLTCRKAMIEEFDLDQDGAINEQEFLAIMLDGE
jgi:hypothetical protein